MHRLFVGLVKNDTPSAQKPRRTKVNARVSQRWAARGHFGASKGAEA